MLLDEGLQVLAGRVELLPELRQLSSEARCTLPPRRCGSAWRRRRGVGGLLEQHQEEALSPAPAHQGDHLEAEGSRAFVVPERDAISSDRLPAPLRLLDRVSQLRGESLPCHAEEVEARRSGRQLEIGSQLPAELQDLHLVVHDHPRGCIAREQDPIGLTLDVHAIEGLGQERLLPGDLSWRGSAFDL